MKDCRGEEEVGVYPMTPGQGARGRGYPIRGS